MNNTMTDTRPLSFSAFNKEIVRHVKERYAGYEVKTLTMDKNNGLRLTGLTIMPADPAGEISLSPSIYLDRFYTEYREGTPVEEIVDQIEDIYDNSLKDPDGIPDFQQFDAVKDTLCYRLINAKQNKERLKKIPHRPFLDLAVVYCVPVELEDGNTGAVAVTDELLSRWQADEETLHACAEANTERLYPAQLMAMDDLIRELCPDCDTSDLKSGLFILRNHVGGGGAGAMLYSGTLREFGAKHGDFYIIPSSIQEVLLLLLSAPAYTKNLTGMIREVNEKHVPLDEVLSDHPYLYHADTDTIEVLD